MTVLWRHFWPRPLPPPPMKRIMPSQILEKSEQFSVELGFILLLQQSPVWVLTKTQSGFRELQTVWEIREFVLRRSWKWAILTHKLGHSSFKPSSFVIPHEILDDLCIVKQTEKKKAIQCGTATTKAMFPHFLWTAVLPSRFSRS